MYWHEMLLCVPSPSPSPRHGPKNQHLLFVVIGLDWDLEKGCPGEQLAILRSFVIATWGILTLAHSDGAPGQWPAQADETHVK